MPIRRLAALALLLLAPLGAGLAQEGVPRFDLLIRDGRLLDGSGNPWMKADVIAVARQAGTRGVVTHIKALGPNVWGFDAVETALALLAKGDASVVSFNMADDDIERLMRQPWTMTSSDGALVAFGRGVPHPRGNGAFSRKLRKYVVEDGVVGLAGTGSSRGSGREWCCGASRVGRVRWPG